MSRFRQHRILIALAVLVVAVAIRYGTSSSTGTETGAAAESQAAATASPSATNVSHEFKRRTAELRDRIDESPQDSLALRELAGMLFDAHSTEEAIDLYERYLQLVPRARQAWLDLATAQGSLDRWQDAEQTMERMLTVYPDDPAATWNLGAILANQGRTEEAARWWHRTVESADTALASKARNALSTLFSP